MRKILGLIAVFAIIALGLTGCGVKGALEAPAEAKQAEPAPDASGKKPHKPFVLDGLIR